MADKIVELGDGIYRGTISLALIEWNSMHFFGHRAALYMRV